MTRKKLGRSLYWRISISFLIILLVVGLAYVLITAFASRRYYEETTQRLNAHVASSMLQEVDPFKDGKVNEEALGKIMHSMMAVNPSLEVYLLDPQGNILSYVVLDKKVKLEKVNIQPVKKFIEKEEVEYILGDDPRSPGKETIFSATGVRENGELLGYVYMVLVSEQTENITSTLLGSYWLRIGTRAFIVTLLAAFIIGLILIWFLTRNLQVIVSTFRNFQKGDLKARIPEKNMKGELLTLSSTFNSMADTILRNIDELKKVDSLRRELIANVSHDLRSPIAVIHGYIETLILKNDQLSPEERNKYLQTILNGSEKLKNLVADLFELSKLEANQVQPKEESFMMNELVADAMQQYRLLAEKKRIHLEQDISTSIPLVKADISMMERVIQNLLSNALQYTPQDGTVKIDVKEDLQDVKVEITNTGEGIPQKDLPHLFERYYKVGKENSGIEGTGLGLAIVKKILDLHNIQIQVDSKPGKYASFAFKVPAL